MTASAFTRSIGAVSYDEDLADRIRDVIGAEPALSEKKMFGGLAFLIGGNMAVAASGLGGILVRVDPAQSERLSAASGASVAVMRGRPMAGWLRVEPEQLRTKRELGTWVERGVSFARSLPVKKAGKTVPVKKAGKTGLSRR